MERGDLVQFTEDFETARDRAYRGDTARVLCVIPITYSERAIVDVDVLARTGTPIRAMGVPSDILQSPDWTLRPRPRPVIHANTRPITLAVLEALDARMVYRWPDSGERVDVVSPAIERAMEELRKEWFGPYRQWEVRDWYISTSKTGGVRIVTDTRYRDRPKPVVGYGWDVGNKGPFAWYEEADYPFVEDSYY